MLYAATSGGKRCLLKFDFANLASDKDFAKLNTSESIIFQSLLGRGALSSWWEGVVKLKVSAQ